MCNESSMRTSQLNRVSRRSTLPELKGRCSDNVIATELPSQCPHFDYRMVDCVVQPSRHDSVVLMEH
jgi:hypothetical protein